MIIVEAGERDLLNEEVTIKVKNKELMVIMMVLGVTTEDYRKDIIQKRTDVDEDILYRLLEYHKEASDFVFEPYDVISDYLYKIGLIK